MSPRVSIVLWEDAAATLLALRTAVFVHEQGVPIELERDEHDPHCVHVLAESAAAVPIGTGRLMPEGRIGRMAVLRTSRGQRVGQAILHTLMQVARERGQRSVHLHAQEQARAFYERQGFRAEGPMFEEAGIRHVPMRAPL